jgi:phosphoribosylamine--glycine ligase
MGAFAPSPLVDTARHARIMREIVGPVLNGMRAEGLDYRGFLYAGLMLTCDGPKVIEFNVRFGDPEAQVVLPLIAGDLLPLLTAAADGALGTQNIPLTADVAVGVVLAAGGYPGAVTNGTPVSGIDDAERVEGVTVFHAGTTRAGEHIVTAGGRVLTVVATGPGYADAIEHAYDAVRRISFDGMQYRHDIGQKALAAGDVLTRFTN